MAKAARSTARKAGSDRAAAARKLYQAEYTERFVAHPEMVAIRAETKVMIAAKSYFNNDEYQAREQAIYKRVHADVRAVMVGFKAAA